MPPESKPCCDEDETSTEEHEEAENHESLTAAGDNTETLPERWHACLTVEGLRTTDHRAIAKGALTWRQLPLALFAQFNNAGHFDAPIAGQITSIERDDATGRLMAEGTFDLSLDDGQQAARMCLNQTLRWGSLDLEVLESRYVEISTSPDAGEDIIDILFGDPMDDCDDWYEEILAGRIMGFTMVATPAFPQAVIAPIDVPLDIPEPMGSVPTVQEGLLASAIPTKPPATWFENPQLSEVTGLVVQADGRIFGHLALWDTCHIGYEGVCVVPPRSNKDYAYFKTGRLETSDGTEVSVGHITFDGGHASTTMGWQDAASHYDNTCKVGADINVGEDDFGIWVAGALRPGVDDEDIRAIRSAPLSGDWRKIGGGLELVAALSVNVPGFPIVASAGVRGQDKDKEQVSLITAGLKPRSPLTELALQVAEIKQLIKPLRGLAIEQLSKRVNMGPSEKGLATLDELRGRVYGGIPSKGTKKDRRLKENKAVTATK